MTFNTISVIGLGYIGLPTAAMFASKEKKVIGVDLPIDLLRVLALYSSTHLANF